MNCPTCNERVDPVRTPQDRRCCPNCGTVHPDDRRQQPYWEGRL